MAITLFRKRNFEEGDSLTISGDVADLHHSVVGGAPSSLRMTSNTDRCLLFTKRNFRGEVMFLTGRHEISALGLPGKGGRIGFGDTVASVRLTPFTVKLMVNVVCAADGSFDGFRSTDEELIAGGAGTDGFPAFVPAIVAGASAIWNPFLITLELDEWVIRRSDKLHHLRAELYPLLWKDWKKGGDANVFLVGALHNASGICPPVGFGKGAVVECPDPPDLTRASDVLAHELGHYFGMASHVRDEGFNLMTRSSATSEGNLTRSQVEKVHSTLAYSPARIRLRQE